MVVKSRRKAVEFISDTGVKVEKSYCRKCMELKDHDEFYTAVDTYLDSNGLMSVCRSCMKEIYDRMFMTERTLDKAILRTCRILNIRYDQNAVDGVRSHIETMKNKGSEVTQTFGLYKGKLGVRNNEGGIRGRSTTSESLTFVEPGREVIEKINENENIGLEYFEETWGKGMNPEDYDFLEKEYTKWRNPEGNTQGEEVLIREICHIQNNIAKNRVEGKSTTELVKNLQDLMKNSALTPALARVADQGKIVNTWGNIAKMIETEDPAEHYDKNLYKDYFNVGKYAYNYIVRPIMNFFQGTKNYELVEDDGITIEDESLELEKE
jgi:hypothetical protein